MGKLREFIAETYANDPKRAVRFINQTVRLVKVGRHWWRGYRKMSDGTVAVSGRTVEAAAATKPSWKLLPTVIASEFSNFERAIDDVVSSMCVTKSVAGAEERQPLVFGGGVYAIDVAQWPTANQLLKAIQIRWDEAADAWCTDDGYQKFRDLVKEQVGATEFEHVQELIPKAHVLRGRFWLEVTPLAFRLTEEVADGDENRGRATAVTELVEAAVKGPRDEAAAAWSNLAHQLADVTNGVVKAARPVRKNRDGTVTPTSRRIRTDTVINAAKAVDGLNRAVRFHDATLTTWIGAVKAELSADKAVAEALLKGFNSNDQQAERVARILLSAAAAAADENAMCIGFGRAVMAGAV